MLGKPGRRLLLAVAAVSGAGGAAAAAEPEDTVRLGRFRPADVTETRTTPATSDDTGLIHWRRGWGWGGGFSGGWGYGYYTPAYYGGWGWGGGFYRPWSGYGVGFYSPVVTSYYYAPAFYNGFCWIGGGLDVPTVPLTPSRQPLPPATIPPARVPQPMPPPGTFKYDGDPKPVPQPMPAPADPRLPQGGPQQADEGVRVSLPAKPQPRPVQYKYAAYGEKK